MGFDAGRIFGSGCAADAVSRAQHPSGAKFCVETPLREMISPKPSSRDE